jgi:hypothetical protein
MSEEIRNLAVSYPFLPGPATPEELKHIKDVRIVYTLPAIERTRATRHTLEFSAVLAHISESVALFNVTCVPYDISEQVAVPVYVGIDTCPTTNSYVIVSEPVDYNGQHPLHPDCLLFLQEAPKLKVRTRTNVTKVDEAQTTIENFGDAIKFGNGHNVIVEGNGTKVTFSGGVGSGLGVYTESPYIDDDYDPEAQAEGLRSINGIVDSPIFTGAGSVLVSAADSGITLQTPESEASDD